MAPTIQPGDLFMRHDLGGLDEIRRGMIVVYEAFAGVMDVDSGAEPGDQFVFRVVGLPGDRLALRRDTLYVNGRPTREPYAMYEPTDPAMSREAVQQWSDFGETVVPEDAVFVLGDNRYNALDSRFVGPVPMGTIRGYVKLQ